MGGEPWRPVAAIPVLFAQVNATWPNRDKASDGVVGDAAHQDRESDHNPDANGWVHAQDIDDDLRGNPGDADKLADQLLEYARTKQPGSERLKNIVYKDRVASGTYPDKFWVWRYNEALEHFSHIHVSYADGYEKDARPFNLPILMEEDMPTAEEIAKAVWATKTIDPVTKAEVSYGTLLKYTRINAKQASVDSTEGSNLTADEIAVATANELAQRLES